MRGTSGAGNISSEKKSYLTKLTDLLEEQIAHGDSSVEGISREMGESRSTFYRKIKKYTGSSPAEFIKKKQLEKAASLLKARYGNVSEIAYKVGFNNLSYFSKCFKREFGVSPSSYTGYEEIKNSLPCQLTSFVGRERDLEEVRHLIAHRRLITLTGPAGTGKTRLALETANRVRKDFRSGTTVVFLGSLTEWRHIPSAIIKELNLSEKPDQPALETLINHLKKRELLLVLDNFEHLTQAAPDIKTLLQQCRGLTILITSREALRLSGEYLFSVAPLAIPDIEIQKKLALEDLLDYPSVRLFNERAQKMGSNFQLTEENASAVVEICSLLDGLPLALELAASQTKLWTPDRLADLLKKNLFALKSGEVDRPERHQTLQGAIQWSYDLLPDCEKRLLQKLSLFTGSFNLEAAEAVSKDENAGPEILESIRSLLDKNFLQTYEADKEIRFKLLETIKVYGRKRVHERGQEEIDTIRRITRHYLRIVEESDLNGADQKKWIDRFNTELDNFRGILTLLEKHREVELGLKLSTALWRYWNMQNMIKEGGEWLNRMINLADNQEYSQGSEKIKRLKGKALSARGILESMLSKDFQKFADIFQQCIKIFQEIDDKSELAENLNHYGWIKAQLGDYETATQITLRAKEIHENQNNERGISVSLHNLGWIENIRGNLEHALEQFSESVRLRNKIGDRRGSAYVSTNLAGTEKSLGKPDKAMSRLEDSLKTLNELNDRQLISWVLTNKGYILYDMARFKEGQDVLEQAIHSWSQVGNRYGLSLSRDLLGLCLLSLDRPETAKDHIELAEKFWSGMNSKWGRHFSLYCKAKYQSLTGTIKEALTLHKKALARRIDHGEKLYICESLEACSEVLTKLEDHKKAITCFAAAAKLRKSINAPLPARFKPVRKKILSESRAIISSKKFDEIWDIGKNKSLYQLPL